MISGSALSLTKLLDFGPWLKVVFVKEPCLTDVPRVMQLCSQDTPWVKEMQSKSDNDPGFQSLRKSASSSTQCYLDGS